MTPERGINVRNNEIVIKEILHDSLIPAIIAEDVQKVHIINIFFLEFKSANSLHNYKKTVAMYILPE